MSETRVFQRAPSTIDAAARVGIIIDREGAGIGEIYTRTELEGLARDFRPRDPDTGRIVH